MNEEVIVRVGPQRQKEKKKYVTLFILPPSNQLCGPFPSPDILKLV